MERISLVRPAVLVPEGRSRFEPLDQHTHDPVDSKPPKLKDLTGLRLIGE